MNKKTLIILSAPGCQPCEKLKRILDELGEKYTVKDVVKEKIRVKGVPQLVHGDPEDRETWSTLTAPGAVGSKARLKEILKGVK